MKTAIDSLAEAKIVDLCRKYSVRRLCLFGSAATGDFDVDKSDYDFLVMFDTSTVYGPADQFFGFKEDLEELLGRQVDLVDLTASKNPFFMRSAQSSAKLIYEA
jgi:predicted nucleotidyltransferase